MTMRWRAYGLRLAVVGGLLLALMLTAAGRAQAVDIDADGVVAAGEVINDDVLLFSSQPRMDGTINGNLIASGENVTINGTVNGDVIVWANNVTVNGTINGNLFLGGNVCDVNAPVKGSAYLVGYAVSLGPKMAVTRNLFFAGLSLEMQAGSQVGVDALVTGGQALLQGEVGQDVLAGVEGLELQGKVGRNVKATVGSPSDRVAAAPMFSGYVPLPIVRNGLNVAETATIGGKLTYTSAVNQDTAIKAVPGGGHEFVLKTDTTSSGRGPNITVSVNTGPMTAILIVRDFLTLMALGSVLLWGLPALSAKVVAQAQARLLPAAGWGMATFFLGYIALGVAGASVLVFGILFAVVTFGGLASSVLGVGFGVVGLAFTLFSLLVAYGSKLVVAHLLGQRVMQSLLPQHTGNRYGVLAVGTLLYVILRDLPNVIPLVGGGVGWVIGVLATCVGLGAMLLVFNAWRAARPAAGPALLPEMPAAN